MLGLEIASSGQYFRVRYYFTNQKINHSSFFFFFFFFFLIVLSSLFGICMVSTPWIPIGCMNAFIIFMLVSQMETQPSSIIHRAIERESLWRTEAFFFNAVLKTLGSHGTSKMNYIFLKLLQCFFLSGFSKYWWLVLPWKWYLFL